MRILPRGYADSSTSIYDSSNVLPNGQDHLQSPGYMLGGSGRAKGALGPKEVAERASSQMTGRGRGWSVMRGLVPVTRPCSAPSQWMQGPAEAFPVQHDLTQAQSDIGAVHSDSHTNRPGGGCSSVLSIWGNSTGARLATVRRPRLNNVSAGSGLKAQD